MAGFEKVRRTQQARREATREALLNAAVECICDLGYANTTVALVARRAKVTPGAVQHHFGSRNELIMAVIAAVGELNFDMEVAHLQALPLPKRIDEIIANYRSVFSSRLFRAALNIWLGVGGEPELYQKLAAFIASIEGPVNRVWRTAFKEVKVSSAQLQSVRRLVMAAVRGYVIEEMFGLTDKWQMDAALLRRMVSAIIDPVGARS